MRKYLLLGTLLFAASGWLAAGQQGPIAQPEAIAGRWETADGSGGMVGMNITLTTHVVGTPLSLVDQAQYLDAMEIGLYRRTGLEVGRFGFNFFEADPTGGASWDGEHLQIHVPGLEDLPVTNVELTWQAELKAWTGHFERGEFSHDVRLMRPENPSRSELVGTWFRRGDQMNNCLHIAQQADGAFTAWADDISNLGRIPYGNGIEPPSQTREHYGEIAKVNWVSGDKVRIELRALTAMCCSFPFVATVSADGTSLVGEWAEGAQQMPRHVEWKKMPGDSCLAAASEPAAGFCPSGEVGISQRLNAAASFPDGRNEIQGSFTAFRMTFVCVGMKEMRDADSSASLRNDNQGCYAGQAKELRE